MSDPAAPASDSLRTPPQPLVHGGSRSTGAHALRPSLGRTDSHDPDGSVREAVEAATVGDSGESLLTETTVLVTAPRHRIQKRAPVLWTIEGVWSWLVVSGLQVGWYYWGDNVMAFWNWVALCLTAPMAFLTIVVAPWWRYLVARWDVSDTAVCSRTGWWTTHLRIAPLSRLQTVYTTRNIFERWFRLATVHASTASAHGSVEIRGLSVPDAEQLAEHLLAIANLEQGDAT